MTIKKQPQIRFGGFGGDWVEIPITEILCVRKETADSDLYDLDVELENLVSNSGILIGDTSVRTQTNSLFKQGDILFGRLRPYLNKWWLANQDGVKSGEIWALETNPNYSNLFTYRLIQSEKFLQIANVTSGTKMPRADWKNVAKISFRLPEKPEQIAIGQFFRQLDEMLTLAEQKHAQTVQLKKALLGKLFPISGSLQPQIRLKGFSGDWVERKLGDCLLQEIKGKAQIEKLNTGNTPYLDASFLNGGKLFLSDGIQDVQKDDVLIIWDGSNAGKVYFGFSGALGSTLKAYKTNEKCYSAFLYQELLRNEHVIFNQYRTPNIPHVIKDFTEEYVFRLPENIAEQTAIGKLFQTLDHTIALQAKEITQIKQLKSALLGKMFV